MPALPQTVEPLGPDRASNAVDEYALLLARYGQPNTVTISSSQSMPVRTAIYDSAHLAIIFIPNGCFAAYEFIQQHQKSPIAALSAKHSQSQRSKRLETPPKCIPQGSGSEIVRYDDPNSGSAVDAEAARQRLGSLSTKSSSPPSIDKTTEPAKSPTTARSNSHSAPESAAISFQQETLRAEADRLQLLQVERAQDRNYGIILLVGGLGLFIGGGLIHRRNCQKRITRLFYELNDTSQQRHTLLDRSIDDLAKSQLIWRVIANSPTYDWKRNAGASSLITRKRAAIVTASPPRVESNLVVRCLDLNEIKLYFLPDLLLYRERNIYGAIAYGDLRIGQGATRFIENEQVPTDARQVGQTWKYVRKDGGPDRRFNDNALLPIMQYGALTATSSHGLNILLHASNYEATAAFANSMIEIRSHLQLSLPIQSDEPLKPISGARAFALKMLGLGSDATADNISQAYRGLARMYHPDKVSGLASEFQDLAERRMKEINAAYALLK